MTGSSRAAGSPGSRRRTGLLLLLPVALLVAAPAPAQDNAAARDNAALVLALDDALRIAAERNRDIAKAREFRRQVEARYVAERAAALPQVTVTADLSWSEDPSQSFFFEDGGGALDTRSIQGGLSQPLYTWGQVGAAIRAARLAVGTADAQLLSARQAAARDVTVAFHDVLLAQELADIARQTLDQRIRHLDEARKKLAAGTATDYDVLAADVAVANARPEVIRTENLVLVARENLRFLLGLGGREVEATGTLEAPVDPYPRYEEALAAALGNRPDIAAIRSNLGIGRELVRIAAAGNKPRLDLRASYGWQEIEAESFDGNGTGWSAGLFATWTLFDGFRTRGRVAQAESDVRSLRIDEARLLDAVALETRNAVNAVRDAGEIIQGLAGTVAQAERLLSLSEKGFEFGVKTRLEVEDAELNLAQARGSLARARRAYLVARVTLEYVTGTLAPHTPAGERAPWRPADTNAGLIKEIVSGEPALDAR